MSKASPVEILRNSIVNVPSLVQASRKYLSDCVLTCFAERPESLPFAERICTASAELLENALKYSPAGTVMTIRLLRSLSTLTLKVENALREEADLVLKAIHCEIAAVWAEKDAKEAFRKRVLASLLDPKSKAMLGYAKIRMETGGQLRAKVMGNGRLEVSLTFALGAT